MDDGFDVYGDLEDFDLGEKVKEVSCFFVAAFVVYIYIFIHSEQLSRFCSSSSISFVPNYF